MAKRAVSGGIGGGPGGRLRRSGTRNRLGKRDNRLVGGVYVEAMPVDGVRVEVETPCYKSRFDPDPASPFGTKTTYVDGSILRRYDGGYNWVDWGRGTVGCYLPEK